MAIRNKRARDDEVRLYMANSVYPDQTPRSSLSDQDHIVSSGMSVRKPRVKTVLVQDEMSAWLSG